MKKDQHSKFEDFLNAVFREGLSSDVCCFPERQGKAGRS